MLLRRSAWEQCGGYDETMRSGFEDWEFFLRLLETRPDAQIGIVPEPLLEYRTAPASSNIQSMDKRLSLMRFIIEKHLPSYQAHLADALLGWRPASILRLSGWEAEIRQSLQDRQPLSDASRDFLAHPLMGTAAWPQRYGCGQRYRTTHKDAKSIIKRQNPFTRGSAFYGFMQLWCPAAATQNFR